MNSIDLVTMLGNVSQALVPVQKLISGASYLLGVVFFFIGIERFKGLANKQAREKAFIPLMYLLFGAGLIYLPTTMSFLANTAFGLGNVLTYGNYNIYKISDSMDIIIRTAGLLWFVRGSVLLVHASEPGVQEGPKGLAFIIAGIFAMNINSTIAALNTIATKLIAWTLKITS